MNVDFGLSTELGSALGSDLTSTLGSPSLPKSDFVALCGKSTL